MSFELQNLKIETPKSSPVSTSQVSNTPQPINIPLNGEGFKQEETLQLV